MHGLPLPRFEITNLGVVGRVVFRDKKRMMRPVTVVSVLYYVGCGSIPIIPTFITNLGGRSYSSSSSSSSSSSVAA